MSQIQIALEGGSAIAFAGVLKGIEGIDVSVVVAEPSGGPRGEIGERLDRVLVTLMLASNNVDLLSDSVGLLKEFKDFQGQPIKTVLVDFEEGQGLHQLKLENATPEEILTILNALKAVQ